MRLNVCRFVLFVGGFIAAASGSASAFAPLSFNVSVNSSSVPGFTPTTFNQIVNIDGWTASPAITLYPFSGNLLKSTNGASADLTGTPYTASLLATIAPINPGGGGLYAESGYYQDYSNGAGQIHFQHSSAQFYQSGAVWYYDVYDMEIAKSFNVATAGDVQSMSLPRITQLMTLNNPMVWTQFAQRTIYDAPNGNQIGFQNTSYSGTATFVAVLPEPGTLTALATSLLVLRRRR